MQKKIFVIGSSNTDMVIKADKLPKPGETIIGGVFLMNPGGKGANQAVAAAKLGADVTLVSKTGNDIFGKEAINGFKSQDINTDFVYLDIENPSGIALILVDNHGENSIAVASGANGNLQITEVEKAIVNINPTDIVLLQLEIPLKTVEYAIKACFDKGAMVVLNPAPAQSLNEEVFKYVDIITPNETEAELLTGIVVVDEPTAILAANVLHNKGIETVIITMGSKGAFIHNSSLSILVSSPVVKAIDSTAAGDVFNGALVVAIAEGKNLEAAVKFACKVAAISVTRLGAQASAPLRSEIE